MQGSLEMFLLICNNCKFKILPMIVERLSTLEKKSSYYFPSINTAQYDWIRSTFAIDSSLTLTEKKERGAVSTDRGLMIKYKELFLEGFWIFIKEHFSISKKAQDPIAIFHLILK